MKLKIIAIVLFALASLGIEYWIYDTGMLNVTVDMKQDLRQSGSKGFVGKRQTRDWKWTIEVTNSHTQPVAVRVEDPEPQIGDSAIEVKVVAKPAPVVKDHVNTWNLTVPASGKSVIDYTVEASAPEDMRLIYGR